MQGGQSTLPNIRTSEATPISEKELVLLLLRVANELASGDQKSHTRSGIAVSTLFDILFERHFISPFSSARRTSTPSDRILDCLLCMCNEGFTEVQRTRRDELVDLILVPVTFLHLRYSRSDDAEKGLSFVEAALGSFVAQWQSEVQFIKWTPMPWSARSQKEGIPPPTASFDGEYSVPSMLCVLTQS